MQISFRSFRAVDEPDTCREYIDSHVRMLMEYGIPQVTSNNNEWISNRNVYGVIAESVSDKKMVGGIRVQIADGIHLLPVETAIGHIDPKIHTIVKQNMNCGVGELCGLWVSKNIAGKGISMCLTRAGISIINQLKCKTLLGICAQYTLKMFSDVGFVIDKSLGDKGDFIYPNKNYIAWVLIIRNTVTLETASEYDRTIMMGLREHPIQKRIENGGENEGLEVGYNLILPSV